MKGIPKWCIKKEREGEAKNPGPEEVEAEDEAQAKQQIVVRQFNITNLDKNGNTLLTQEADILGVAGHKLSESKMAEWKQKFRDGYWKLTGSRADGKGKTPQAGVAIATKTFIKHIEAPITTDNFRKAHELGRVRKAELDLGWDCNFCIYEAYGMAGGSKAAKKLMSG